MRNDECEATCAFQFIIPHSSFRICFSSCLSLFEFSSMNGRKGKARIVSVGGRISGLAAAYRLFELQSQNHSANVEGPPEVLLLEASERLGGTVRTYRRDGFLLEGGPDSFISEKPAALELARRLG